MLSAPCFSAFFFFNDTATTEIYTLSLHDALPISVRLDRAEELHRRTDRFTDQPGAPAYCREIDLDEIRAQIGSAHERSEEHTSELQSLAYLVCRLLLEKKKKKKTLQ